MPAVMDCMNGAIDDFDLLGKVLNRVATFAHNVPLLLPTSNNERFRDMPVRPGLAK